MLISYEFILGYREFLRVLVYYKNPVNDGFVLSLCRYATASLPMCLFFR